MKNDDHHDDFRARIAEAKQRLPLPALLDSLGIERRSDGKPKRNPLREDDRSLSFSTFLEDGLWFWKDHGDGRHGDEIGFLEALRGCSRAEAIAEYLDRAGVSTTTETSPDKPRPARQRPAKAARPAPKVKTAPRAEPPLDWPACVAALDDGQLDELARSRGYSIDFCRWLRDRALIGAHRGKLAVAVHDAEGRVIAAHVRLGEPVKWIFTPRGLGTHALVIGPADADKLLVAESQWDAFAFLDRAGWHRVPLPGWAVCITRGASNGRLVVAAGVPRAREGVALVQADKAGEKWLEDVALAFARPLRVIRPPAGVKDMNDWLRADAALDVSQLIAVAAPYPAKTSTDDDEHEDRDDEDAAPAAASTPPSASTADLEAIAEKDGIFWLEGSDKFFRRSGDGLRYLQVSVSDLRRRYKVHGLASRPAHGEKCSELDRLLVAVQEKRIVDWSGNVGGFRAGVYRMHGRTVLVKESPTIIEPKAGDWTFIEEFLNGRLNVPPFGERQLMSFVAWCKFALESLLTESRMPGPALGLIGPSDCGKSRIQFNLLTPLLGGRDADPSAFLLGKTEFNSELVGAEHHLIEDMQSGLDSGSRYYFGEMLKKAVVGDIQRGHAKGRDAITLSGFRRVSISANDNPERLRVLPPISSDLRDKFLLLKVQDASWPCPMESPADREAFRERIIAALPAFAHYLLQLDVPAEYRSRRFGVRAWQHPEIVAILNDTESEFVLLALIDEIIFGDDREPWTGTASELERKLTADSAPCAAQARKLFKAANSCGILLGKLADKLPQRVRNDRHAHSRDWIITPAAAE